MPHPKHMSQYRLLTEPFDLNGIASSNPIQCIASGLFHFPTDYKHKFPVVIFHCPRALDTVISPQYVCKTSPHISSFYLKCPSYNQDTIVFYDKNCLELITIPLI